MVLTHAALISKIPAAQVIVKYDNIYDDIRPEIKNENNEYNGQVQVYRKISKLIFLYASYFLMLFVILTISNCKSIQMFTDIFYVVRFEAVARDTINIFIARSVLFLLSKV